MNRLNSDESAMFKARAPRQIDESRQEDTSNILSGLKNELQQNELFIDPRNLNLD